MVGSTHWSPRYPAGAGRQAGRERDAQNLMESERCAGEGGKPTFVKCMGRAG